MKYWKLILACLAFFAAFVIYIRSAIMPSPSPVTPSDKPMIAVSFYPLEFVTSQVVGDTYDLFPVIASGVEPHDFEPSPQDIVRLQQADMLIYNGLGLEPWVERLAPLLREQGVLLVDASAFLRADGYDMLTSVEVDHDDDHGLADPHVWLDPQAMASIAKGVVTALSDAFPADVALLQANGKRLQDRLAELDTRFNLGLADCSLNEIIVSHDAFGYMARQYGFSIIAIAGFSPQEQPSAKRLGELASLAQEKGIKTIFVETLVSPKLAETLAQEVGAETAVLDPLEGISRTDREAGANYVTVMQQNLKALQGAMQCR